MIAALAFSFVNSSALNSTKFLISSTGKHISDRELRSHIKGASPIEKCSARIASYMGSSRSPTLGLDKLKEKQLGEQTCFETVFAKVLVESEKAKKELKAIQKDDIFRPETQRKVVPFSYADFAKITRVIEKLRTMHLQGIQRVKILSVCSLTYEKTPIRERVFIHLKKQEPFASGTFNKLYTCLAIEDNKVEYLVERTYLCAKGNFDTLYDRYPNFSCKHVLPKPQVSYRYIAKERVSKKCSIHEFYNLDFFDYVNTLAENGKACAESVFEVNFRVLLGLVHFEKNNLVHKDIKEENILLRVDSKSPSDILDCRICDLDHCSEPKNSISFSSEHLLPKNTRQKQDSRFDMFCFSKQLTKCIEVLTKSGELSESAEADLNKLVKKINHENQSENMLPSEFLPLFLNTLVSHFPKGPYKNLHKDHASNCLERWGEH